MTNFEKITASPEALGEFLASLTIADGPWEEAFHRAFCDECQAENCDAENCPHNAERDNPLWWLNQTAEGGPVERRPVWRNGMLNLEPGVIIPLENPLQVHIRVKDRESPLGQMLDDEGAGARLELAWKVVEKIKKVHPDAVISVSVDVQKKEGNGMEVTGKGPDILNKAEDVIRQGIEKLLESPEKMTGEDCRNLQTLVCTAGRIQAIRRGNFHSNYPD